MVLPFATCKAKSVVLFVYSKMCFPCKSWVSLAEVVDKAIYELLKPCKKNVWSLRNIGKELECIIIFVCNLQVSHPLLRHIVKLSTMEMGVEAKGI